MTDPTNTIENPAKPFSSLLTEWKRRPSDESTNRDKPILVSNLPSRQDFHNPLRKRFKADVSNLSVAAKIAGPADPAL